jgi:hypothetical protein
VLIAPGDTEIQAIVDDTAVIDEEPISVEFGPKFIEPAVQVSPPSVLRVNSLIVKPGVAGTELSNAFAQITLVSTIEILFKVLAEVANPVAFSCQNWAFAKSELIIIRKSNSFFIVLDLGLFNEDIEKTYIFRIFILLLK